MTQRATLGVLNLVTLVLAQACASSSDNMAAKAPTSAHAATAGTKVAAGAAGAAAMTPVAKDANKPASPSDPMTGGAAPMTNGATPGSASTPTNPMLAGNECGLHTKYPGDEYCILPPPPDKGFQVHIGPTDYDNPESKYVLAPGGEVTENFPAVTGNDTDVYYYYRQYRMRPGSHHVIVYAGMRRLGGTQNHAKDNPEMGIIAPENQGVGMKLAAKTALSLSLHYINLTQDPIIKEVWINFWYRDPADVKEPANEMFSMSPMRVTPGQHVVIAGSCPISQAGRVVTLYGHRHANNLRFSAWRVRGGQRDLVYDDYDWVDPLVLEYSSLVTNMPADPTKKVPGGWTGILELQVGDTLDFECEIANMTSSTFVGLNEAKNDEMCILVGDTVGTTVPGRCSYTTTPQ